MVEILSHNLHFMYTSDYFMNLANINVANQWDMETTANEIIKALEKIDGAWSVFGTCRLHKHFLIEGDECVVTTFVGDSLKSVVKPYSSTFFPCIW